VRSSPYLLGIDIGTSSTKGVLIDVRGNVLAEAAVEHDIRVLKPGWVEQDPDECYWRDFKIIAKTLMAKANITPNEIAGIGISGLSPVIVPIDRAGNVIRPALIYSDRRAVNESKMVTEKLGLEQVIKITGNIPDPYFGGYKLIWYMRNEPENYRKTWKVLNAEKYVILKLTGEAVIDRSTATLYAPYYDWRLQRWSEEISSMVGGGLELLPDKICESCEIVGYVTREAAAESGLIEGIPVIAGGVDALASAYSVGVISEGDSVFTYGTTSCWLVATSKPMYEPRGRLIAVGHVIPGKYALAGAINTTGALLRWFRDNFGHIEKSFGEMVNMSAYELLDMETEKINPGSDGLFVLPYFLGERTPIWDPDARGLIFGLTLGHTRAHVYKALMEAVGYALKQHIEIVQGLGIEVKKIIAVNGGAKSKLWRQIISDITGFDQFFIKGARGAPYGDAFLAGVSVGVFKKFEDIKFSLNPMEKTEPNRKNYEIYSKLFKIYEKLYESSKPCLDLLKSLQISEV